MASTLLIYGNYTPSLEHSVLTCSRPAVPVLLTQAGVGPTAPDILSYHASDAI